MASTVSLSAKCGYNKKYRPVGAKKPYVARILGRDSRMTFEREFLGENVIVDTPGIYEVRHVDKKGMPQNEYVLVLRVHDDEVSEHEIRLEEAMKIARWLDVKRDIEKVVVPNGNGWDYALDQE